MIDAQENKKNTQSNDLSDCPFCGEKNFDKVGLKSHLEHKDCKIYNEIKTLKRLYDRYFL